MRVDLLSNQVTLVNVPVEKHQYRPGEGLQVYIHKSDIRVFNGSEYAIVIIDENTKYETAYDFVTLDQMCNLFFRHLNQKLTRAFRKRERIVYKFSLLSKLI